MEFVLRRKRAFLRRATIVVRQWLTEQGVGTDETCDGGDPAWAMTFKLFDTHGPGTYHTDQGTLYKGDAQVLHRDDIRAFLWGVEVEAKVEAKVEPPALEPPAPEPEAKPVPELQPSIRRRKKAPIDPKICPKCGKESKSAAGNAAHMRAKH